MLALARGLMACPRLLCLDDPFLGLQRSVTDRFCQAVHAITAGGLTILAAGQHVRRLLRLAICAVESQNMLKSVGTTNISSTISWLQSQKASVIRVVGIFARLASVASAPRLRWLSSRPRASAPR